MFRRKAPAHFTTQDFQTLSHYRNFTSQTIGDGAVKRVYATEVVQFATQVSQPRQLLHFL